MGVYNGDCKGDDCENYMNLGQKQHFLAKKSVFLFNFV